MSETIPESEVQAAVAELDKVRARLMERPAVTAVDVGLRYREGQLTDELAIRVHVARKLPRESLAAEQLLPETLGRFPVDVIEAAYEPQELPAAAALEPAPEAHQSQELPAEAEVRPPGTDTARESD